MSLQPPEPVVAALFAFDERADTFELMDVAGAIENAVDFRSLPPEHQRGWWAEWAAFSFDTHPAPEGGPWKTYFQPMMSRGTVYRPDLRQADAAVIAHWTKRARDAKHPVLIARYADLVWDTTKFATHGKPPIEFARLAIDAYIASFDRDDGTAWGDNYYNLGRALSIAISIRDEARLTEVVRATIDYAERTAEDDKLGTYVYLFDNLIPPEKAPPLTAEQERQIIERFELMFAQMTTPGGPWDLDPHSPCEVGERLARYYVRKGRPEEQAKIHAAIAAAFERRAKLGDALSGLLFLEEAREFYQRAGRRDEVERVQIESQRLGPEAEKGMKRISVKQEIPDADVEKFLEGMVAGGIEQALTRFAVSFVPDQREVAEQAAKLAKEHPFYGMLTESTKKLDEGHIEADVGDDTGDPDGRMAYRTAHYVQFDTAWIAWVTERLVRDGLTTDRLLEFVAQSPLFMADRLPLVRQAIDAHFAGDFAKSVHLLIPQIERALVNLQPMAGKPSNKAHRTGRGVMQFKNLNDVLDRDGWPIPEVAGENLRMYLLSVLAHPKGMNIRNDVCHGLWSADAFTRQASERTLHVLLAISLLKPSGASTSGERPSES
ncbi:MAG: hypothetical protein JWN24_171 [Phycisphaerales bacterium]|nr:hypothetical protein [Phycisphaerales bacterium]